MPLPSAQQWLPPTITAGPSADIIPIHPAISRSRAAQRAADQQVRDAEIEATRKGAWFMWYTSPEQVERLAANSWSPVWIENNTPKEGWPPGDGPENYSFSAVAPPVEPEDDGVVPPLVLKARQMGLEV